MSVVQKALEEAIQKRDKEIDELKCRLNRARNALYSAIVYVNNECQGVKRQNEMYDHLNEAHKDSQ
jgi:SMC interacting uncharacterized protein involved in chromosome segregation